MAGITENIGLALLGVSDNDKSVTFEDWRTTINGETGSSNMHLIDNAIAEDRNRISLCEGELEKLAEEIQSAEASMKSYTVVSGMDYNTLLDNGVYTADQNNGSLGLSNCPTEESHSMVSIDGYADGFVIQCVITVSDKIYMRNGAGSLWSDWCRIYTTAYKPSYSDVGAASVDHEHDQYADIAHTHTPEEIGAAPAQHTHVLDELGGAIPDHTHSLEEIGAASAEHTHTEYALTDHDHSLIELGAASINHTHDEYAPAEHEHSLDDLGVASADHTHTYSEVGAASSSHGHSLTSLSGTLSVAKGGTGSTTASAARTALGITPANIGAATSGHTHSNYAASDHEHDEYSVSGHVHALTSMTGTLSIAKGGTGATSVAAARNALGLGNTSGAVPIANGGTGATTIAAARNALGLGNTSGAVPVANGGTGSTTASAARTALGITPANIGAATSTHTHTEYADAIHEHDEYAAYVHTHQYSEVGAAPTDHTHSLSSLTGTLPITKGGTGSTSASAARTALGITPGNIGAAASDHKHTEYSSTDHKHTEYSLTGHTHSYPVTSVAGKTGAVTLLPANVGIIYSSSTPSGSAGMIWLKPIE